MFSIKKSLQSRQMPYKMKIFCRIEACFIAVFQKIGQTNDQVESARLLTHLDLHTQQFLEHMCVYNMSDYADMCKEPCFVKGYHIWPGPWPNAVHIGTSAVEVNPIQRWKKRRCRACHAPCVDFLISARFAFSPRSQASQPL
jgi:hypothetical protein